MATTHNHTTTIDLSNNTATVRVPSSPQVSSAPGGSGGFTGYSTTYNPSTTIPVPNVNYGPVTPNIFTPASGTNPMAPYEGMVISIADKIYRFSAASNQWIELVGSEAEGVVAPQIPIKLDASDMLIALKEYRTFLEDLDGLDNETGEIVDDVVFGLKESIEALEKLG